MKNEKNENQIAELKRMQTGVPGLDEVLGGGLIGGGVYLVMGPPGSGKTILGNQICFHQAAKHNAKVLYVTLLAESHGRMIGNLRTLDFFRDELLESSIHFLSGYKKLESEGLPGLLKLIARSVRDLSATVLLIDGVATVADAKTDPLVFRKFVHELNTLITVSGCTALLLSSIRGDWSNPEYTMVDGILALHYIETGLRALRQLEVTKFRSSRHIYGKHCLQISQKGITVFPRLEALSLDSRPLAGPQHKRLSTGVPELDKMLGGGLLSGSATSLAGPSGTGKTILGLKFLEEGAKNQEPGIFFGFYETPEELKSAAAGLGIEIEKYIQKGLIEIAWNPSLERELDELGENLLNRVKTQNLKRVFIDGTSGLKTAVAFPDRIKPYLVALILKLKLLGATTLLVDETPLLSSTSKKLLAENSTLSENTIFLSYADIEGRRAATLSIVKTRASGFDHSVREIVISAGKGFDLSKEILLADDMGSAIAPKSFRRGQGGKKSDEGNR